MKIVEGISAIPARAPMDDAMQIAEIQVPPFPSLRQVLQLGQEISVCFHKLEGQHRRFTMKTSVQSEKELID